LIASRVCQRRDRSCPGQQQGCANALRAAGDDVGGDENPSAVEPVGDHASNQHEHHLRNAPGGEHQAERSSGSGQVENREGDRHRGNRAAQHGDRAPGQQGAELALPERTGHGSTMTNSAAVVLVRIAPVVPRATAA
jgi:hypothetical protein